jgi:hypothetical protein
VTIPKKRSNENERTNERQWAEFGKRQKVPKNNNKEIETHQSAESKNNNQTKLVQGGEV